ncbi:hypothetical protein D8S78_23235 [Natrialba swarupiae]|nr:hypothetical protein [Natrialba swarupiae]
MPINIRLDASDVEYVLEDASPSCLLADSSLLGRKQAEEILAAYDARSIRSVNPNTSPTRNWYTDRHRSPDSRSTAKRSTATSTSGSTGIRRE